MLNYGCYAHESYGFFGHYYTNTFFFLNGLLAQLNYSTHNPQPLGARTRKWYYSMAGTVMVST